MVSIDYFMPLIILALMNAGGAVHGYMTGQRMYVAINGSISLLCFFSLLTANFH